MQEATLKIFGTGQITIPKKWRDFFGTNTVKAIFNTETRQLNIKPIKIMEIEETRWAPLGEIKKDLDNNDFNKEFKKEFLEGYSKSNFYKNGLKSQKKS
jgi:bifunctional DNA-binding transcriptional regulator/antitoxin component of YhaV-PrlF toxin-antitoxin module